jgi:predicted nucleotidyltransferase
MRRSEDSSASSSVKVDLAKLGEYFCRDPRIVGATVFGSARDGIVRPGSDLDLAVFFDHPLPAEEFLDFYSALCDQVPRVGRVDLVCLNKADPILAFEAIGGRFLCTNDKEKMAAYFSLVCREYEDVMGNLEHQRRMAA